MNDVLQNASRTLELQLAQLKTMRASDVFLNDLYEAADYWYQLSRWLLQNNTRVNYPERARGEREVLSKLKSVMATKGTEILARYGPLLNAGEQIIKIVGAAETPKDGHLGFLRVVRERFRFVLVDFGFSVIEEEPARSRLSSGKVYLELACSCDPWMSCQFGPESCEQEHFWIHDLLYLRGDERYRTIPEKLTMDSETEVEDWFRFIADVFEDHGRDVLGNQPGIFGRLMQAQTQRDAEYAAAMKEKYRSSQQ